LLPRSAVHLRFGVRNFQELEKGGLPNLVLGEQVRAVAWERFLTHEKKALFLPMGKRSRRKGGTANGDDPQGIRVIS